ncbi:hypothetical protein K438DRAFT_1979162 [Mycena galopus ATCC 62051]|nr:hypothetical protein K438DRAFT_1979162 [Mycena galopus ATCC 62051]
MCVSFSELDDQDPGHFTLSSPWPATAVEARTVVPRSPRQTLESSSYASDSRAHGETCLDLFVLGILRAPHSQATATYAAQPHTSALRARPSLGGEDMKVVSFSPYSRPTPAMDGSPSCAAGDDVLPFASHYLDTGVHTYRRPVSFSPFPPHPSSAVHWHHSPLSSSRAVWLFGEFPESPEPYFQIWKISFT